MRITSPSGFGMNLINRRPMGFPDWTHTNAILFSPDDGNLIVSVRHQNWVVKVDYANGVGTGDILWKLGYQGDFTLVGGMIQRTGSMRNTDHRLSPQTPRESSRLCSSTMGMTVFSPRE